jgi:hypothetical protein
VGEYALAVFHASFFRVAVFEGGEIQIASVYVAGIIHPKHFLVAIRPEHGKENTGQGEDNDDNEADGSNGVLEKALDTVLEEGGGGAHLHHIFLFLVGVGQEGVNVQMKA